MRHRKSGYKLGRTTSHRRAMLRNMVTSLFEHERLITTETKAKAAKPLAEKMITLAKRGDLHARRLALAFLTRKDITHKLFDELKDRFMDRAGGYTSIVRIGPRRGDAAPMAVLELVKSGEKEGKSKKKKLRKKLKDKIEKKAAPEPAVEEEAAVSVPEPAAEGPGPEKTASDLEAQPDAPTEPESRIEAAETADQPPAAEPVLEAEASEQAETEVETTDSPDRGEEKKSE